MSELLTLATDCEEAAGADRSIDGMIAMTIGATMPDDPAGWPPKYTGSIDAALTLLPAYMSSELTSSAASTFTRCRLWDWRRSPLMSDPGNEWKAEGGRPLALNICAAALRARAAHAVGAARRD